MSLNSYHCTVRTEKVSKYVPNYPIHILDVKHISEKELDQFLGDVKAVFGFLKYSSNKQEKNKILNQMCKMGLPKEQIQKNIRCMIKERDKQKFSFEFISFFFK